MIANTTEANIEMTSNIQKRWLRDYMPYSRRGLEERIEAVMEDDWYIESVKIEKIPDIVFLWECQCIISSKSREIGVALPFVFWDEDANVLSTYPDFDIPTKLRGAILYAIRDCRQNPTLVASPALLGRIYNPDLQSRISKNLDEFIWERVFPGTVFAPLRVFIQHMHRYKFAVERIRGCLSNRAIVLDLACGCGYGSHYLASRLPDIRVFGVDNDVDTITDAGRLYSSDRNFWVLDNAEGLGNFPAQAVVSLELLEHIEQAGLLLETIKRLLLPGGVAIISTPNGESIRRQVINNPYHIKEYTYIELKTLLENYFDNIALFGLSQADNLACSVHQVDGTQLNDTDSFIACCQ